MNTSKSNNQQALNPHPALHKETNTQENTMIHDKSKRKSVQFIAAEKEKHDIDFSDIKIVQSHHSKGHSEKRKASLSKITEFLKSADEQEADKTNVNEDNVFEDLKEVALQDASAELVNYVLNNSIKIVLNELSIHG